MRLQVAPMLWPNVALLVTLSSMCHLTRSVCLSSHTSSLCFNTTSTTEDNLKNHRLEPNATWNGSERVEQRWHPVFVTGNETSSAEARHSSTTDSSDYETKTRRKYYQVATNAHSKKPVFIPVAAYSITKKRPAKGGRGGPGSSGAPRKRFTNRIGNDHHGRHKMAASSMAVRRKLRPIATYSEEDTTTYDEDDDTSRHQDDSDYEMKKESAVYGYVHKPEIIEFRGQYYYGGGPQNAAGSEINQYNGKVGDGLGMGMGMGMGMGGGGGGGGIGGGDMGGGMGGMDYEDGMQQEHMYHDKHRVSYVPIEIDHEPTLSALILAKLKKAILVKGITAKGLLIAALPLMLTPLLSYLLTPVIIPITATVAAGGVGGLPGLGGIGGLGRRRKRQTFDNSTAITSSNLSHIPEEKLIEAKVLLEYLNKVKPNEDMTHKAVSTLLEADGLFQATDHCMEQLSCEFSDLRNQKAGQLERSVTSIILGHLLKNEFVSGRFKKRLKRAAVFGREHSGGCRHKFPCQQVLLTRADGHG